MPGSGPVPIAPRPPAPHDEAREQREREAREQREQRAGVGSAPVLIERRKRGRKRFSCAECRRLKLKCSKAWPCTMCERRGCASICPEGVMERERKKRVEPVTDQLHARIAVLEAAIKDDSHPPHRPNGTGTDGPGPSHRDHERERDRENGHGHGHGHGHGEHHDARAHSSVSVSATAGSLSIGTGGETRYVGSLAGSAYLRDRRSPPSAGSAYDAGSAGMALGGGPPGSSGSANSGAGRQRRDVHGGGGDPLADLRSRLPPWDEGRSMAEAYWDHVNWIHQVVPRPTFEAEYLPSAYGDGGNPHQLACVFLAMAIGVMFDLSRPPFHPRGKELFNLGRQALERSHEKASVATVQALVMVGTFIVNDNDSNGAESYWPTLGQAVKIALSVGLHRDGEAFGLDGRDVEERRKVFWELMEYDRTQALSFGRPCGLSNRHADTKFPSADGVLFSDDSGYHHAKHCLVKMMERVVDIQVQPTPVPYSAVVDLDLELQEFRKSLPESLMCSVAIQDLPLDTSLHPHLVLQRFGIRLFIAEARLHLNRAAFVQALKASPTAPSHGTFAAAFVALYESAQEIVQVLKQLVLYSPALAERWWFFWFHAFSAAVCLAAIAIEAPTCGFAQPAFSGLSIVCDLSGAARDGCRVKDGLSTLLGLRKRARERLDAARSARHAASSAPAPAKTEGKDDELHRLLLAERRRDERPKPHQTSSPIGNGNGTPGGARDIRDLPKRLSHMAPPIPNPLAPVRPHGHHAQVLANGGSHHNDLDLSPSAVPRVDAGPTIPLWPDAASVLIDYAGLEASGRFEISVQPFLTQLEGYAWGPST